MASHCDKTALLNRRTETIFLRVQPALSPKNTLDKAMTVFLMHGYGEGMDTLLMRDLEHALLSQGYRVIAIDASHSFNDADGVLDDHTPTKHWHDLEDVIAWAKAQDWFQEPYGLMGHSAGGLACLLHAQTLDDPNASIAFIAPIATAISGSALDQALKDGAPDMYAKLRERGYQWMYNNWNPKTEKRAKRHIEWLEDMKQYDILPIASAMKMPLFLCSGDQDIPTPPHQQKALLDAWSGAIKNHYLIKEGDHDFSDKEHRATLTAHLKNWLQKRTAPQQKPQAHKKYKP